MISEKPLPTLIFIVSLKRARFYHCFHIFYFYFRMVEIHMAKYPSTISEDEERLESKDMSPRARYSLYTAHGQKKILSELINACNAT